MNLSSLFYINLCLSCLQIRMTSNQIFHRRRSKLVIRFTLSLVIIIEIALQSDEQFFVEYKLHSEASFLSIFKSLCCPWFCNSEIQYGLTFYQASPPLRETDMHKLWSRESYITKNRQLVMSGVKLPKITCVTLDLFLSDILDTHIEILQPILVHTVHDSDYVANLSPEFTMCSWMGRIWPFLVSVLYNCVM